MGELLIRPRLPETGLEPALGLPQPAPQAVYGDFSAIATSLFSWVWSINSPSQFAPFDVHLPSDPAKVSPLLGGVGIGPDQIRGSVAKLIGDRALINASFVGLCCCSVAEGIWS